MTHRYSLDNLIIQFTIFLLIVWSPIQVWILKSDGAGRIPALFALAALFIVITSNRKLFDKVSVLYLGLITFIIINGYIKGGYISYYPQDPHWIMFWSLSKPYIAMLLMNYSLRENYASTINLIMYSFLLYCVISIIFSYSLTSREDLGINANEIALTAGIAYGFIFFNAEQRHYSKLKLLLFSLVPIFTILITASRMGLIMIAIITFYTILKRSSKHSAITIFSLIACIAIFVYILNNTEVGTRMQSVTSTTEENEELQTGTLLDNFGDRGFQYYSSWQLFRDNAVTGIGFMSWPKYNPTNHVCHSEYLFQYLENGLVGLSLYLLFLFLLYRNLRKQVTIDNTKNILKAIFLSIVFANFVLWTYSSVAVFAFYSLILARSKYTSV